MTPREALARRFRRQATDCAEVGSPLYGVLLAHAAADIATGGPTWELMRAHAGPPGSVPGLRLMGAVHRLVLAGGAPALAAHFPSTGGDGDAERAWPALRALLAEAPTALAERLDRTVQTNAVGRAAALLGGFLTVAAETGLPLRALELGASAGLNLHWDGFRYESDGRSWGDPAALVRLPYAPPLAVRAVLAERAGCDPEPVDPATEDGRLTLVSYVWADQAPRITQLEAAIALARRAPVAVERAGAADWLERRLEAPAEARATVVYHSIVMQYLSPAERARVDAVLAEAGARASRAAPLARLAFEPAGPHAEVRLTTWPGGEHRLLARSGYHGAPIEWLGPTR